MTMSVHRIRKAIRLLQDEPQHAQAWSDLEEVATSPGEDGAKILRALEDARAKHEGFRDWELVAKLLELEIPLESDVSVMASKEAELARVFQEELLDEDAAVEAYRRLAELRPDDSTVQQAVRHIETAAERWSETAETYLVEALECEDAAIQARLLASAADTTYRFGGATPGVLAKVIEYVQQALQKHPGSRRALDLAAIAYRRAEQWDKLADVLTRKAKEPPKEQQIAAARHLVQLARTKLADPARTVDAYQSLLDVMPANQEALAYLVNHYSEHEDWDRLAALYETQLSTGSVKADEELGVLVQLAMLNWKTRNRPAEAEPYFERVRRQQPTHAGMLQFFRDWYGARSESPRLISVLSDAQRALAEGDPKRAIMEEIASLAEGQENARRAIDQYKAILRSSPENAEAREALKRLYRQTESHNALVELYRQDLERLPQDDRAGRTAVLREMVTIYRETGNDSSLLTVLTQIMQLDDKDVEAVRALTRVYESLGRWRDLLNMQQHLASLTEDRSEKVELLRAVARRWLEQFSNVQNAISAYEALVEVDPYDREGNDQLRDLYLKRRAWPKLYELYDAQLDQLEGEDRVPLMTEMAKLAAERLDRGADAIRLLKEVLVFQPQAEGVLDQLEKQAERQKDWPTVAHVLERRVEQAADDKTKLALLQKLGVLCSDRLEDATAASRAWRRVLELSPGHARALRVLRQSYVTACDWDGLQELYRSQTDAEGLADFLSTTADRVESPVEKVELSFRAARVYEDDLGAPERAVRSYERVLGADEKNVRAARALLPLYEREEKWSRLPGLYMILLGATEDVDEKITLLQKVAEITGGPLANKAAALSHARQAYELRPDEKGLDRLEAWSRQSGEWTAFIDVVRARLVAAAETDAAKRRALRLKLARVYAHEVERIDDAVQIYRELVEVDPDDTEAVAQLEELLRAADRRDDLRWLFGLKCERLTGDERSGALEDWAAAEENVFGEPGRAIELLQQVIAQDPRRASALGALTRLLVASEQFEAASKTMLAQRDALAGAERAEIELKLSALYLDRLTDPRAAFEACARALAIDAHNARAVGLLEQLMASPDTRGQAADRLEVIYAETGQATKQVTALRALLEARAEPADRLVLCQRLADVHEQQLDDAAEAFEVILNTLVEFPGDLTLWDRAAELSVAAGKPTDLAQAYRTHLRPPESSDAEAPAADQAVDSRIGRELQIELCARAAVLHEEQLGDAEGAIPYLERVLELEPANPQAFERLKQILNSVERWGELEQLYRRALETTPQPAARAELLQEVAIVAEEMIGNDAKAIGHYEQILELDSLHEGAMAALERLYGRQGRHAQLAVLLERRLEATPDAEAAPIHLQLVELYLHKLEAHDRVMKHLEGILLAHPSDADARKLAEECLGVAALRQAAALLLDGVYEARDEIRDLVRVLEAQLEGAEETAKRRELLRRIGTLRDERLKDDAGAFHSLCELLPLEPDDVALRQRYLAIGKRLGEHARMAEVLEKTAQQCAVPAIRGEILMAAAAIYRAQPSELGRAEAVFRRVLEIDPDEPALVIPAARALSEIYQEQAEHAKLAEVLGIEVRLIQDAAERAVLHQRVAALYEDVLGEDAKAIAAWRARLGDDASDVEALRALERLFERTEQWDKLVEVLRSLEQAATEVDDRRRCMVKAARTLADRLDGTVEAINAWRAVLDDFGPEIDTLAALATLYEKAERWEDLGEVLEGWLPLVDGLEERVELFTRLGHVRRLHLGDQSGALSAYRDVLLLDSSHKGAREALEAMLELPDPDIKREAAQTVGPLYEADGDAERLLKVLDIEIAATFEPEAKLDRLKTAMHTAEDALQDRGKAFAYACRAVREAVGDPTIGSWLGTAERLAAGTERWAELVELLEGVLGEILDAEIQQKARLRAGEIARTLLKDDVRAIRHYQKALEDRADDRRAMVALEELYESTGEATALLEILRLRAEAAENDEERVGLLFRIAKLQQGPIGDRDAAIDSYEELLNVSFAPDAVRALEELYQQAGRYQALVDLYDRELTSGRAVDIAAIRVKVAQVAHAQLKDSPRAMDELNAALEVDPAHVGAIETLEQMLEKSDDRETRAQVAQILEPVYRRGADWGKLRLVIEARLDNCTASDERADLLRQLATLFEEQLEDYSAAMDTMAKLLRDDPGNEEIWGELVRLSRVLGADRRLAEIYAAALADVGADDPKTADLSRRTGELFRNVGSPQDALKWYRRAYEFSPDSDELFRAIDQLLIDLERPEERVEHYRGALDQAFEDGRRIELLHVIAGLQRTEIGKPDDAVQTLRDVLQIDDRNARALDALTELYQQGSSDRDLAELYLQRAELADDPEHAASHRLALARLLNKRDEERERAIDQLEVIVSELPGHAEATAELEGLIADAVSKPRVLELLRPLYERAGNWQGLVRLNDERLKLLDDVNDRVTVLSETANLWEVNGGDSEHAFRVLREAFELAPADEQTRASLERLAEELDAWDRLGDSYAAAADAIDDDFVRRQLLNALASVYDERLADPRSALGALSRLSALDPSDPEPFERMIMLCMLLGDWRKLVEVLEKKAELSLDEPETATILRRVGSIKAEMLEDENGAVAAYQRALEIEPESIETLDRLIELFERRDDAAKLVGLIEQRVELSTDEEEELRYELTLRGARCHEERLGNSPEAIRLLTRAQGWRPQDAAVLTALERLYRAEQMHEDLLENLKAQAAAAEAAAARLDLHNKIGDLYLAQFDNAFDALEQYRMVLDAAPTDAHAIEQARKIGREHEDLRLEVSALLEPVLTNASRFRELCEVMELRFSAQSEASDRARTLGGMALIQEEQLDDPAAARDTLLRAARQTPDDAALHDDVVRLCELTAEWGRYADTLSERAGEELDSVVSADLYTRLGRIAADKLDDPERAIKAYDAAVERAGQQPELLEALDRLYARTGDAEKLAETLAARVQVESGETNQAELCYRLALVQIESFAQKSQGLATLREVVERVPDHAGARKQLESLTAERELFEDAAEMLENMYHVMGDNAALAGLYEKRIGFAPTASDRVQMRLKLARMFEDRAFDTEAAQLAIEQAFLDEPGDAELLGELERLGAANAAGGRGAEAWRTAADAVSKAVSTALAAEAGASSGLSMEQARDLYLRAARWYKTDVGDTAAAEKVLGLALEQDTRNADTLAQLESLHRAPGREADLVATLRRLADLAQSPGSGVDRSPSELRREAKDLAEKFLEDGALAEKILRETLQAEDTDRWALAELCRMREKAEDWAEVYTLLSRRIELSPDAAEQRALRHQAADIASSKLGNREAAIDLYEQAFQEDSSDDVASEALRKLYEEAKQYDDMLRLLERLTELASTAEQRGKLRLQSAKMCIDSLDAPTEGIEHLRAVLEEVPGHEEAVQLLSVMLEKQGRDDELAELMDKQIALAQSKGDRSAELGFRVRLAELYESRLNEPDKAIAGFLEVLEKDAGFRPALKALARLYEQQQHAAKAAGMLDRLLAGAEPAEAVKLALKACDLYVSVKDEEAACRALEGVLATQPRVAELRDRLRALYRGRGAWDKLGALVAEEAEAAAEPAEKVVLFRQAAEIHATQRSDHGAAADLLKRALDLQPDDRDLMLALCDAYTASGRGKDAVQVLQRVVASYGGRRSKELADIHLRIASAHQSDGDNEAALREFEAARKMDPGSIKILSELGKLSLRLAETATGAEREAHIKSAGNSFRSLLLQKLDESSPVSKGEVFFHIGEVHRLEGDTKKAIQMLERALAHDSKLERAQVLLKQLKG
jgi:tetratricopeptide (TPR) repeat protein